MATSNMATNDREPGALCRVLWRDAWSETDPGDNPELWPEDCSVCTVGWVVRETERSLFLASERIVELDGRVTWRGITCIPRPVVVDVQPLREVTG